MNSDYIVFCDFDDTLTTTDTFFGMMNAVCGEARVKQANRRYVSGECTLVESVCELIETIPSEYITLIDVFLEGVTFRPGIVEFFDYLKARSVPLVLISGGVDYVIDRLIDPYKHYFHAIHRTHLDFSGEKLKFISDTMEPLSLLNKALVVKEYGYLKQHSICIGDGTTDMSIADKCATVFARSHLKDYMVKHGLEHVEWEDFFDVLAYMDKHLFTT